MRKTNNIIKSATESKVIEIFQKEAVVRYPYKQNDKLLQSMIETKIVQKQREAFVEGCLFISNEKGK